jgi:cytochrome c peroxidase
MRTNSCAIWAFAVTALLLVPSKVNAKPLSDIERLGKLIFLDKRLSNPAGQSCATCHSPAFAFTDPEKSEPTSNGVLTRRFGKRNTPTISYSAFSPSFFYDSDGGTYVGGQFLDGRVDTLQDQAKAPFFTKTEMHNLDAKHVVAQLEKADYAPLFKKVFGQQAFDKSFKRVFDHAAEAIAAFEASDQVSPFTSKFDYVQKGKAQFTKAERRGLALFNGKANCFACHPSTVQGAEPGALFTDFTYDNIGIPKNWDSRFLDLPDKFNPDGRDFVDYGLAETVTDIDPEHAADEAGKFKVTTLRNVGVTGPYGHNGYFKSLKQIVHFYNTRDVRSADWPDAEVPETVNHDELGDLGLTDAEEDDIVTFLLTLTDGYKPAR